VCMCVCVCVCVWCVLTSHTHTHTGGYTIVQNVPIDPATAAKMQASNVELIAERDAGNVVIVIVWYVFYSFVNANHCVCAVAPSLGIKKANMKDTFNKWKTTFEKNGKLPVSVVVFDVVVLISNHNVQFFYPPSL
jgi:hypothetical protein